ncbi:MAG: acyltransferase [Clostridia bacterium]|nr:acyltransferase [Clostridia bacterium]
MIGRIYRKIKTTLFKIVCPGFTSAVLFDVPRVYFKKRLNLGKKVHFNDGIFINSFGGVAIGDCCVISHGVTILSTGLNTSKWLNRKFDEDLHVSAPVVIGKNVWLCANVTVCAGVSIADNSIIAAGSVVTHDLTEEGCLYGGIPANKIKELKK